MREYAIHDCVFIKGEVIGRHTELVNSKINTSYDVRIEEDRIDDKITVVTTNRVTSPKDFINIPKNNEMGEWSYTTSLGNIKSEVLIEELKRRGVIVNMKEDASTVTW